MKTGLSDRDLAAIRSAAQTFSEIEQIVLFGSRAKGNFEPGSDIDLAIKGSTVSDTIVRKMSGYLNQQSSLPYFIDLLHFDSLTNQDLIDHINRVGYVLYQKEKPY